MMSYNDIIAFWKTQKINNSAELSAVLDSYSINFAYHSGKIENDNITYHDTREIFTNDGVSSYTGDLRTLFEIRNAKNAYNAILDAFDQRQPITEEFVKKIHKLLTVNTYDSRRYQFGERPGEYKIGDYVTGKNEVGAAPEDVHEEMSELLEELNDVKDADAIVAATYFHAKFENIHPFSDGNGRAGRLLMNYFLILHNHPPIIVHEEDRKPYYQGLEYFDTKGEIFELVHFFNQQLERTWGNYLNRDLRNKTCQKSLKDVLQDCNEKKSIQQKSSDNQVAKKIDIDR